MATDTEDLENLLKMYFSHRNGALPDENSRRWTKFNGDLCARQFKRWLEKHLRGKNLIVEGSNVYIKGFPTEVDLLVVRGRALPEAGTSAYRPEDVVSWFEVKAHGLYGTRLVDKNRQGESVREKAEKLLITFKEAIGEKHGATFAYVTLAERCNAPKGEPKENSFWGQTKLGLQTNGRVHAFCLAKSSSSNKMPKSGEWRAMEPDGWAGLCNFVASLHP